MWKVNYYLAVRGWYNENRSKMSPLRRKVFKIWLKIMKKVQEE